MKRSIEEINNRCEKLQKLGFEVNHMDSNVSMYAQGHVEISFDFSSVPEELWFRHSVDSAYIKGVEDGKREAKDEIKKVLGIN